MTTTEPRSDPRPNPQPRPHPPPAAVVSTPPPPPPPQDLALADAKRGADFLRKAGVRVLGVVENMTRHVCARCGHMSQPFGRGSEGEGGRREGFGGSPLLDGVPVLASLPLETHRSPCWGGDEPGGVVAGAADDVARGLEVWGGAGR